MNTNQSTHALPRRTHALLRSSAALVLGLAASLAGCGDPPVDSRTPTPKGVIRGTVQYIGRRVDCTYVDGQASAVNGILILTLLNHDNPLPPEGTAQLPTDLKAIGGEDIFDLSTDCLPEAGEPNPAAPVIIQRSASFEWTRIPLGPEVPAGASAVDYEAHYRILGIYDQEGDFNPLFDVTQAPSAGDIVGGAIENPLASPAQFLKITFDSVSIQPLGQVVEGVNVSLGAVVVTDSPVMRIVDGDLSSEAGWPGLGGPSSRQTYPTFDVTMFGRAAGVGDRAALDHTLDKLGLSARFDFANTRAYAWYIEPLDVDHDGNRDCPGPTDPDCHPTMRFAGNALWNSPVVFLQRFQNTIEAQTGIPSVALIPAAGMETTNLRSQYPDLRMRVAPLATVLTNPAVPECIMLYFANGSPAGGLPLIQTMLPGGTSMECSEVPTGYYGTNLLGGFGVQSAAQVTATSDPAQTNINPGGFVITNGDLASQLWKIPNALGDFHQVGDVLASGATNPGPERCLPASDTSSADPLCLPNQSLDGAFVVRDPNPANPIGRNDPAGAQGTCGAYTFPGDTWAAGGTFHDTCCGPIAHLCGVPLCPFVDGGVTQTWSDEAAEMGMAIRSGPTRIASTATINGERRNVPDCLPFPMPSACCPVP